MSDKQSIYDRITATILRQIEDSPGEPVMPWHRPAGSALHIPKNATTNSAYRGINILMLWMAADSRHYPTGLWASYQQWAACGAQVRKGEKGTQIIFYKQFDVEPDTENEDGKRRVARTFSVFNAAQVDGFQTPLAEQVDQGPVRRSTAFERLIAATGAKVEHGGHQAFYSLVTDAITMPEETSFVGTPTMDRDLGYMSVLAHELGHWTGAKHRLDRQLANRFGTHAHAAEEIIAELTAAFICAELGLAAEPRADHAHYIAHYLKLFRGDTRAIFSAAAAASKAASFLLSFSNPVDTPCLAASLVSNEPTVFCTGPLTVTNAFRSNSRVSNTRQSAASKTLASP